MIVSELIKSLLKQDQQAEVEAFGYGKILIITTLGKIHPDDPGSKTVIIEGEYGD